MRLLSLIFSLSWVFPALAIAQGSSFKTDFRMIDFDQPRTTCVSAQTQLYENPDNGSVGALENQATLPALGVSLDQDWIAVQVGGRVYLVRPNRVRFGAC